MGVAIFGVAFLGVLFLFLRPLLREDATARFFAFGMLLSRRPDHGGLREERGYEEEALAAYERFFDLWKDGEMDRERIREVERKLD